MTLGPLVYRTLSFRAWLVEKGHVLCRKTSLKIRFLTPWTEALSLSKPFISHSHGRWGLLLGVEHSNVSLDHTIGSCDLGGGHSLIFQWRTWDHCNWDGKCVGPKSVWFVSGRTVIATYRQKCPWIRGIRLLVVVVLCGMFLRAWFFGSWCGAVSSVQVGGLTVEGALHF